MRTDKPRLGIPTASNFHLICTNEGKMGRSEARKTYLYKLVYERITGKEVRDSIRTEYTEDGIYNEEPAARALSLRLGAELMAGCFMTTNDYRFGCTPDRFVVGRHEAVEIKAPAGWTHIEHMIEGPGNKYRPQVQGQLWIGEFDRVHFWSWNPHPELPPVYIETTRDDGYINTLKELLDRFYEELERAESFVRRSGNVEELELHLVDGEMYLQ